MNFKIDISTALWIYWTTALSLTIGMALLRSRSVWSGADYWVFGNIVALTRYPILIFLYQQSFSIAASVLPASLMIVESMVKVLAFSEPRRRRRNGLTVFMLFIAYLAVCFFLQSQDTSGSIVTGSAGFLVGLFILWQGWLVMRSPRLAQVHGSKLFVIASFCLSAFLITMSLRSLHLGEQRVLFQHAESVGFALGVMVNLVLFRHVCLTAMIMALLNRKLLVKELGHRKQLDLRKQAEAHASHMANVAKEKQSLLEILTHEVRQPLNNAQAALQDFLMSSHLRHQDKTSGGRLQVILDQVVLALSNAIVGADLLERKAQAILVPNEIITICQLACSDAGPDWEIKIELMHPDEPVIALCDPILLRLALRNLLDNALRHSPLGRKVSMDVLVNKVRSELVIVVSNWTSDRFVFDKKILDRGERGNSPVGQGRGLGLHIVKEVAVMHGGTISARTGQDQRTEFTFSMPLEGSVKRIAPLAVEDRGG